MILKRWLTRWQRKKVAATTRPLGLTDADIEGIKHLTSMPAWKHFMRALDALGEQQAGELASGLPHDKYLFASGALTALRRVYTLADDLIAAATKIEELSNARDRKSADLSARHAASFVNTPWYDGWRRDAAGTER